MTGLLSLILAYAAAALFTLLLFYALIETLAGRREMNIRRMLNIFRLQQTNQSLIAVELRFDPNETNALRGFNFDPYVGRYLRTCTYVCLLSMCLSVFPSIFTRM